MTVTGSRKTRLLAFFAKRLLKLASLGSFTSKEMPRETYGRKTIKLDHFLSD